MSEECVEDKIEVSQQVKQKDKEGEKLKILQHQSSSFNIATMEIPKREHRGLEKTKQQQQ